MKQILYLFVLLLFCISCQDSLQNQVEVESESHSITLRDIDDCEQSFTPGNV